MSCSACPKPATIYCRGCKEGLNVDGSPVAKTYYCSKQCQQTHWSKHEEACSDSNMRKVLYRAGNTLLQFVYRYLALTFMNGIDKVTQEGSSMIIQYATSNRWFNPIPHEKFPIAKDRRAAMAWHCCKDALLLSHEFVTEMLQDMLQVL